MVSDLCPWLTRCICDVDRPEDVRAWIHREFGRVYGTVVDDNPDNPEITIELSEPLVISESGKLWYDTGSHVLLYRDLLTEVKRHG